MRLSRVLAALALLLLAFPGRADAAGIRYLYVTGTATGNTVTWTIDNHWSNSAILSTRLGRLDVPGYQRPYSVTETASGCVTLDLSGYWLGVPHVPVTGILHATACTEETQ